ncbi:MAG: hypothetical protein K0Q85_786 [Caproiciproducens sp.]|nr:hypothetical protein [Caproiciproducens sp.]
MFLLVLIIAIKLIRNRVAKPVEISATVMDKRKSDYTKYIPVPELTTDYIFVFQSENKKLTFATSMWNYDSVKKGQHGVLKYQGSHMISFK